ncbi:sensor histidine kinase [Streptomyces tsukubensis]|uniref:Two-component sensor histidine kinase n=1 Tax=Streptomyces tsukubensis TaxID=83656 RepID=A0A1V4ADZ7_9ACTN|nr:histidine kinase [Streptomyces tsukubensis]OON81495.1 two-component sensor histidine kinase [Streptomyces tsukubensis]QFR95496.1 two-component sensor histidine kinase [Streptomyces tsukubensis]
MGSILADDAPAPSLRIQLSALQALCRQVIGVRLAVIGLGIPFALQHAADGLPRHLVLASAVLSFMGSYAALRDWERVGPLLLRHPALLAVDLAAGSILLLTASPDSPLGYAAVCTPLLAGLLYGWRGSGVFTGLQLAVLLTVYRAWDPSAVSVAGTLLIGGFCVAAGIIGVTLRNLMFRFGAAGQALADANARLAVADALESERARLAREMHDSVAKTLHGVALAADALAVTADRTDPGTVRRRAALVAASARRAAVESRELLADLRRRTEQGAMEADVRAELSSRAADFAARTGVLPELRQVGRVPARLAPGTARELLAIAGEALENTARHASATRVSVEYGTAPETAGGSPALRLSVLDNGKGLPPGLSLHDLRAAGHFGLVGMVERAVALGARIRIGTGRSDGGTEVRLDLPLPPPAPDSHPTFREEAIHAGEEH